MFREMTICAQTYHPIMAIIHRGKDIFRIIFFSFRNLVIAQIALPIPANLLVAIAICGGSQTTIKSGATINQAPQEMADMVPATSPRINIKKIMKI